MKKIIDVLPFVCSVIWAIEFIIAVFFPQKMDYRIPFIAASALLALTFLFFGLDRRIYDRKTKRSDD